jgi:hypothetical protein
LTNLTKNLQCLDTDDDLGIETQSLRSVEIEEVLELEHAPILLRRVVDFVECVPRSATTRKVRAR